MRFSWQRIKQRKIIQWALAYLAAATLVIGLTSDLAQGFAWAVVVLRVLVAVLAAGFVGVLIVAWYHGERGEQRVTASEALLLGIVVIVAGAAGWMAASTSPTTSGKQRALDETARIAVLPCDHPGSDAQLGLLSMGLAEQVIANLTQLATLRPIAFNSVRQYQGARKDYPRIADQLDASAILDCSVQRQEDDLRVTFHLIDVTTRTELWAQRFERKADQLVGSDAEIALQVVEALDVELSASERSNIERFPRARNQDAWFEYLRGLQLTTPRQVDLEQAIAHFSEAIQLDSTFAPAHAGLADALTMLGEFGLIAPRDARDSARAAAQRALSLNDKLGEAYAARGWVEFWFDWDWAAAEADLKRALQLNPSSSKVHFDYANYLVAMQRHADAERHLREAVTLDPLNGFTFGHVGWALYHAGKQKEAIETLEDNIARFPDQTAPVSVLLAWFKAATGDYRGALESARTAENGLEADPWMRTILGVVYARTGRIDDARRALEALRSFSRERFIDPRNFAFINAALGDTALALTQLEEAYRLGSPQLVFLRAKDFLQEPMQGSPRYQALIRKMRFPAD